MSMITVDDLNESRELDRTAELRGGYYLPMVQNLLASFTFTKFTQNEVNLNIVSGAFGINSIGSISAMPVSAGSPMTLIQGV